MVDSSFLLGLTNNRSTLGLPLIGLCPKISILSWVSVEYLLDDDLSLTNSSITLYFISFPIDYDFESSFLLSIWVNPSLTLLSLSQGIMLTFPYSVHYTIIYQIKSL